MVTKYVVFSEVANTQNKKMLGNYFKTIAFIFKIQLCYNIEILQSM